MHISEIGHDFAKQIATQNSQFAKCITYIHTNYFCQQIML